MEDDLLERLVQSLRGSGISKPTVKQARRLGAVNFSGTTNPAEALTWLANMEKILHEGMECLEEDKVRISGFMLDGDAKEWWVTERTRRHPTWEQFKEAFNAEYCPPAYREAKRKEFEGLTQGTMTVAEYETKFRDLSKFCLYMIPDDITKMQRF